MLRCVGVPPKFIRHPGYNPLTSPTTWVANRSPFLCGLIFCDIHLTATCWKATGKPGEVPMLEETRRHKSPPPPSAFLGELQKYKASLASAASFGICLLPSLGLGVRIVLALWSRKRAKQTENGPLFFATRRVAFYVSLGEFPFEINSTEIPPKPALNPAKAY